MKSTAKILAPYKDLILEEIGKKDYWAGLRLAERLTGYRGYGFDKWLKELTGVKGYGLRPYKSERIKNNYWLTMQGLVDADNAIRSKTWLIGVLEADIQKLEKERKLALWKLREYAQKGMPGPKSFQYEKLELCEVTE